MFAIATRLAVCGTVATLVLSTSAARGVGVYDTGSTTSYFTPFSASTPAGTRYGESGYLGSGPARTLASIRLGLATFSQTPAAAGTVDLVFTFNDGDPSGLIFGPGTTLYSTTVADVELPDLVGGTPAYFGLTIPLPNVVTDGNFNNIGWSVAVQGYDYAGSFGFQNRGGVNALGFYTNNASVYSPATNSWSLFAFGPSNPRDIANFVATVETPEPATMAVATAGLALLRRRGRR